MDFLKGMKRNGKESELEKEMKSLNLRKAAVSSSIDAEISKVQQEIDAIYFEAGKQVCSVWMEKEENADMTSYCAKLQGLFQSIKEWQDKKVEMTKRFDEELALINSSNMANISYNAGVPNGGIQNTGAATKVCPGCGATVAANDMFCQSCGKKLQ